MNCDKLDQPHFLNGTMLGYFDFGCFGDFFFGQK